MNNKEVYKAIILFGVVSFLGDVIYEGARGIIPSYLAYLGASAFLVGLISGVTEFIGISFRFISGFLVDLSKSYWTFYILGYALIVSIPLLGLSNSLQIAVILILIERIAKGIRAPARDSLISFVSRGMGPGKAFGIHEALDQIGAVTGPLIMGLILLYSNNYSLAFLGSLIPYLFLITSVLYIYRRYSWASPSEGGGGKLSLKYERSFWMYNIAVFLNMISLIHVSLIVLSSSLTFNPGMAALLYMLIQLVDTASALVAGFMFDRYGRAFLYIPFALSIAPSCLTLLGGGSNIVLAAITFGIILGMQESIYRAAISTLVPENQRGSAYGIFNAVYGVGNLISAPIFGYLIQSKMISLGIYYTIIGQLLAIIVLFLSLGRKERSSGPQNELS
ncbi:MFS transporter [Candidatus Korarchaeum cryptofilum]|uniref:MFS transporter n=1 Tax=Candidatus Korarchaeum cryptofilum TaxID=498846 RepID=UPI00163B84EB|nr:MFS transporter [Candidatus Korarchaeum cryptofilum]